MSPFTGNVTLISQFVSTQSSTLQISCLLFAAVSTVFFCSHMPPAWSSFLKPQGVWSRVVHRTHPLYAVSPSLLVMEAHVDHDLVPDINHPGKQTFFIPYLYQITTENMLDFHDRRNCPGSHHGSGNLHTASQKVTSVFIDATFPLGVLDFLSVQKRGGGCFSLYVSLWSWFHE